MDAEQRRRARWRNMPERFSPLRMRPDLKNFREWEDDRVQQPRLACWHDTKCYGNPFGIKISSCQIEDCFTLQFRVCQNLVSRRVKKIRFYAFKKLEYFVPYSYVATVCATADGLKVTVEDNKSVQGNAYIQSSLFDEYEIKEETVIFKINLNVLLECLNIFGSKNNPNSVTTVKMCYAGYGSPLVLILEENGVLTDCKLQTLDPEDVLDFEFTPSKVVNKIIMQSELLKEAWGDLDMNSDVLELTMSPEEPYFQLTTKGSLANIHINFSKDSDMIESFDCSSTVKNRYQIFLIKPSLRALLLSSKVSIRIDERGFLCMQYMIKMEGSQCCFVEYLCSPNVSEDD